MIMKDEVIQLIITTVTETANAEGIPLPQPVAKRWDPLDNNMGDDPASLAYLRLGYEIKALGSVVDFWVGGQANGKT